MRESARSKAPRLGGTWLAVLLSEDRCAEYSSAGSGFPMGF